VRVTVPAGLVVLLVPVAVPGLPSRVLETSVELYPCLVWIRSRRKRWSLSRQSLSHG